MADRIIDTPYGRFALRAHADYFKGLENFDLMASESMHCTHKRTGCNVLLLAPGVDPETVDADLIAAELKASMERISAGDYETIYDSENPND